MSISFTGVNTGNSYTVGERYQTPSGREYEAQRDGSFVDVNTGASYQGSRDSSESEWSSSSSGGWVPNHVTGQYQYVTAQEVNTAIGSGGTKFDRPAGPSTGGGNGGSSNEVGRSPPRVTSSGIAAARGAAAIAAVQANGWLTGNLKGQNTDVLIGGHRLYASPKWSNAEELETAYGEVAAELYGLLGMGAAVGHTAARAVWGPNVANMNTGDRARDLSKRAERYVNEDLGGIALDAFMGGMNALDSYLVNQEAIDNARQLRLSEQQDLWDAKDAYEWQNEHLRGVADLKAEAEKKAAIERHGAWSPW